MTTVHGPTDAGVSIRQAVHADLLDVYRIETSSFPQPWPFSSFVEFVGEDGFLVADAGPPADSSSADVVGYVVSDVVPNDGWPIGHVKDLAVHPDRRGEGIGRSLLERSLQVLGTEGVTHVKLEVRPSNEPAQALYAAYGFRHHRTVSGYYADGENAHVLVADLRDRQRF
ncbi:GNAT family N-acetyltransferase [Halobacteriaceae archaeon GCM10025711]